VVVRPKAYCCCWVAWWRYR